MEKTVIWSIGCLIIIAIEFLLDLLVTTCVRFVWSFFATPPEFWRTFALVVSVVLILTVLKTLLFGTGTSKK